MIKVRYVTQFYKFGYLFPNIKVFESVAELMRWKDKMMKEYGRNFKIEKEWSDDKVLADIIRNEASAGRAGFATGRCEGSTDACILRMDY